MEQKVNTLYIFLIPLLIVGISAGYTVFPICLALLVLRLFVTDKTTVGFYLIMYGGLLGGVIRTLFPALPIYGLLLQFIGIFLTWNKVRAFFKNGQKTILLLALLFLFFTICYFIGPQDTYSKSKLWNIILHGLFTVFGYYIFCSSLDLRNESILQIIFLSTLLMFAFVLQYYGFSRGSLFDYESFRQQEYLYLKSSNFEENTLVSYQHIGMNMLYGFAIFLSGRELNKKSAMLYTLYTIQLILTSGCRQAILGLIVVIILRLTFFQKYASNNKLFRRLLFLAVALLMLYVAYQFLNSLNVDFISDTLESGDAGRYALFLQGIEIFKQNILMGAGLGSFHAITDVVYPHNILVETLCECGIVGLFVFLILITTTIRQNQINLRFLTANNSYLFLILVTLLIRVSVSADFTVSIELFSAIFATLALGNSESSITFIERKDLASFS